MKIHFVCFTVTGSFLITIHLFGQFVRFSQGSFFHANGVFGIWFQLFLLFCMIYCITVTCHTNAAKQKARDSKTTWRHRTLRSVDSPCEAQHEGQIWRSVLVNYTQIGINYAVLGINCYKMFLISPRTTVLRRSKCYTWKTDIQQRAHWLVTCYSSCCSYRKYFVAEQCVHCTPLHYDIQAEWSEYF